MWQQVTIIVWMICPFKIIRVDKYIEFLIYLSTLFFYINKYNKKLRFSVNITLNLEIFTKNLSFFRLVLIELVIVYHYASTH